MIKLLIAIAAVGAAISGVSIFVAGHTEDIVLQWTMVGTSFVGGLAFGAGIGLLFNELVFWRKR